MSRSDGPGLASEFICHLSLVVVATRTDKDSASTMVRVSSCARRRFATRILLVRHAVTR
jgi:hypothetical protein